MANEAISDRDVRRMVIASLIGATIEWYDFFLYGQALSSINCFSRRKIR